MLLALLMCLATPAADDLADGQHPLRPIDVATHVYHATPQGELSLVTYTPADLVEGDRRPGIVFFHGGGWVDGGPEQFETYGTWLAGRNMVAVAAEYRLEKKHGTTPFESIADAFVAFDWVRRHADELHLEPDRIAAGGGSAGGHLAAALATLDPAAVSELAAIDRPDALVLFNPVYDNSPDGYGQERLGDRWREVSPRHNLHADMPPTLTLLGDRDELIPVATAEAFRDAMRNLGVRSELGIFGDSGHGFFNLHSHRGGPDRYLKVRAAMDDFLVSLGYLDPMD